MSLLLDIFNAYKTSMSVDGAQLDETQLKVCEQLSKDISLAIVDFLHLLLLKKSIITGRANKNCRSSNG